MQPSPPRYRLSPLSFFDANDLHKNFPAVDILSANRELGIQVKLTLDASVVREARKKWTKHTEPGEILDGSKEFWVVGAQLDATRPRWKQTPGVDEWARLTDKLQLKKCSDQQLQAMKDRLLTETRLTEETAPSEKESIDRLLGELQRPAVAALSNSEISVMGCVKALEETSRLINSGYKTEGLPKPEIYSLPLMKMSSRSRSQLRRILNCMHDVRTQIARHDPRALRPHRIVDAAKLRLQVEINQLALEHGQPEPYPNVPLP